MSGQSQQQGKGGQGTTTAQPYGQLSGQPYWFNQSDPSQQGSYFPTGTSSRGGMNVLQPSGYGNFNPAGQLGTGNGSYTPFPPGFQTNYSNSNYGGFTGQGGYFPGMGGIQFPRPAGGNDAPIPGTTYPQAPAGAGAGTMTQPQSQFGSGPQGQYQSVAAQPALSTQGLTQSQQGLGMGITPQGTMAFQGSIAQLDPGTARMLGFTQQGNQYVNAQGQVVGRV